MAEITLTFPDQSQRQYEAGSTTLDVAKSIASSLAKKAVAGEVNGTIVDLEQPLKQAGQFRILTSDDPEGLQVLRHTAAFVLGAALKQLHGDVHFGEHQSNEDGFYLDTDRAAGQVAINELPAIKKAMQKVISANQPIERKLVDKAELLAEFKDDPYQTSLLNAIDAVQINVYRLGDYLSFGDHALLKSLAPLKHFELLSVAGAYWQGKSSNPMLQRIYGTAFFKAADLDGDLKRRAEIKERDHRTIGRDLDIFFVDPEVGAGLPYWMPNGATIRRVIERYIIDKEVANGYEHVYTPVLANLNLYKTSGHWDHYREDMFPPMDMGDGEFLELRPMNCPSHIQIYNHHNRSYRELPIRIAELGMMHRYEKSGALSGLQRVREMTLNDGHTFLAQDQIKDEFKSVLKMMMEVYDDFNITDYTFRLSYRDPANTEKYFDDDAMWNSAQAMLKGACDELGLDYYEAEGEAAFYGPKLDVQTKTALGGEETMSTIQLDFMLPEKFDLKYTGADGQEHRPVMMHRGIVGTMERFIAYLMEIYKGAFPTWLAPTQVEVIPVNLDLHTDYAKDIQKQLAAAGVRVKLDLRNEKMGYKIREAQTQKIPYTLVVGDEELKAQTVSVRRYGEKDAADEPIKIFRDSILDDIHNYSRTGSGKVNAEIESKLD
ncbi:threonine--tRNA ligase [Lapidilactobacillus achengensis]|uniref:Threonine--tRNA ligase n=1 Tax=Lapidilactobacillus achengensis TaxID=2486000 RepID=A0ABW1UQH9_9LACO|nr:threonine--tRNA ligase [Lapidilactobacillus achengensis]